MARERAAVVDQWPLVRAGAELALEAVEIDVVVDVAAAGDALQQIRNRPVELVVLGAHADGPPSTTIQRFKALEAPPCVLVLVEQADRDHLAGLATAGADGILLRGVGVDELGHGARRTLAGERVLAPALVPSMVGVVTAAAVAPVGGNGKLLLTPRELAVLAQLADGRTNKEIADGLFMSPATVKSHLARIYEKLEVADRRQAVARALALGLLR